MEADTDGILAFLRSLWLVWLVIAFAAVVFWAMRPKNKARFEKDAEIPFKNDD